MNDYQNPSNWKYSSPSQNGFHQVVAPENSACTVVRIFRLNLPEGGKHLLWHDSLELNGVVISGNATIRSDGDTHTLKARDSFYLPAGRELEIEARSGLILFIGGGSYEWKGRFWTLSLTCRQLPGLCRGFTALDYPEIFEWIIGAEKRKAAPRSGPCKQFHQPRE